MKIKTIINIIILVLAAFNIGISIAIKNWIGVCGWIVAFLGWLELIIRALNENPD